MSRFIFDVRWGKVSYFVLVNWKMIFFIFLIRLKKVINHVKAIFGELRQRNNLNQVCLDRNDQVV